MLEAAVLSWPHPPPLLLSIPPSTTSGSPFSPSLPANYARFHRPTSTSTTTIGRPTTQALSPPPLRDQATTTGGLRRFTSSTLPKAMRLPFISPPFRSQFRAGRPTGKPSPLLKV